MLSLSPASYTMHSFTQSHRKQLCTYNYIRPHSSLARVQLPGRAASKAGGRCTRQLVYGSKDDLEKQLDLTQTTLDRVLQQIQAAQPQLASGSMDSNHALREQQLWDRQQAMLDKMQQHWDQERQAWLRKEAVWHERESALLQELATLRAELQTLLTTQAAAAAAAAAAATGAGSSVASNYPGSSSSSSVNAAAVGDMPAVNAIISGPSSASAAVADAIRAVRDAHVNPPKDTAAAAAAGSSGSSSSSSGGVDSWQNLFPGSAAGSSSSGSSALDSVTAAIAAVDDTDVLSSMDLTYSSSSSSRGRRKVDLDAAAAAATGSSNGSSSSNGTGNAASTTTTSTAADQVPSSSSSSSSMPVETVKGDPTGPPPVLSVGDDDIFWVAKLHKALMEYGFYPSDDEVENWMFSEGTQSALLTFQACNGIAETGTTCETTWRYLLGEDHYDATYGSSSSTTVTPAAAAAAASSSSSSSDAVVVQEESETVTFSFSSGSSSSAARAGSSSSSSRWPVLMDMDGGREVHALQISLQKAGFFCGDDEMRWWQFGSSTMDALKTFQACNGLPESGVSDERTWLALLGADATPDDLEAIRGDESMYEDDMTASHEGAVWLLGEQRWSRPVNGNSS